MVEYKWEYMENLESELKRILSNSDSGHGFDHSQRVWKIARKIDEGEKTPVDMEVVYAACLLHDVGYTKLGSENRIDFENHPQASVEIAKEILPKIGFPKHKTKLTLDAILLHDDMKPWGTCRLTEDRKVWYVQDADNIEAMGAIGITRILDYCSRVKMKTFVPELDWNDPKSMYKSAMHDIYVHIEMYDRLHTETSKKLAKPGVEYMKNFIEQFVKEYNTANTIL
jgi:uncharacterized protein